MPRGPGPGFTAGRHSRASPGACREPLRCRPLIHDFTPGTGVGGGSRIIPSVQGRRDPLLDKVAAAPSVASLLSRLEARVLEDAAGGVSLVGAPPGLLPYLFGAASAALGLKWVVVCAHERDAAALHRDAAAVFGPARVAYFPAPSLTPYQGIPPSLKVRREEYGALARLAEGNVDLLVVPARALLRILPGPDDVRKRSLVVAPGERIEVGRLVAALVAEGYARADLVTECGDLAVRGGLVDVFPPNLAEPVRIELGFEEVESVRTFDPDTQRSTGTLAARPPSSDDGDARHPEEPRACARGPGRLPDGGRRAAGPAGRRRPRKNDGLEELLPLLHGGETPASILDHARSFALAVDDPESVAEELGRAADLLRLDYEKVRKQGKSLPDPIRLAGDADRTADLVRGRALVAFAAAVPAGETILVGAETVLSFEDRLPDVPREIERARRDGLSVVLSAPSKGEREHLARILAEYEIAFAGADGDATAPLASGACRLVDGGPASGFLFRRGGAPRPHGHRRPRRAPCRRPAPQAASEAFLSDLRDLKLGDAVVHRDYGIGLFRGLKRVPVEGRRARVHGDRLRGRNPAPPPGRAPRPRPEVLAASKASSRRSTGWAAPGGPGARPRSRRRCAT